MLYIEKNYLPLMADELREAANLLIPTLPKAQILTKPHTRRSRQPSVLSDLPQPFLNTRFEDNVWTVKTAAKILQQTELEQRALFGDGSTLADSKHAQLLRSCRPSWRSIHRDEVCGERAG